MSENTQPPVYVAGGTVQAAGGVYLERAADASLLKLCRDGAFAFVLTSRQMGKSSLMIRTAEALYEENIRSVIVDLTTLGADVTADQWFKGFLLTLEDQLSLSTNAARWWQEHQELGIAHRFSLFLRKVVLAEVSERVVIFVDEIDTTLRLRFTDDFFTAIRYLYNARADTPELSRVSFVLIGVATPGDLIKDPERTPFNIGQRVELTDFTFAEAQPLLAGLPLSAEDAEQVLRRVLSWTSGHPYLTLRLFRSFTDKMPEDWSEAAIARRVAELYFGTMTGQDSNLQFVRDMLTKKAFDPAAVLETYRAIRRGRKVPDEELSLVKSWLKLSGAVCPDTGLLRVRNRIYETVFGPEWVRQHQRINWPRLLARIGLAIVVLLVMVALPLAVYAWALKEKAEASLVDARKANKDADQQRLYAIREAEKAKQAWSAAESARADALQQKEKAEEEAVKARTQEGRTEEEKNRADSLRRLAEKNAEEAGIQRQKAEIQQQEANEARKAAESAKAFSEKSAAEASRFKEIALARGLAAQSSFLRGTRADPFALSSLLAVESLRRSPVMPAAEQTLRESQPLLPTVIGQRKLPEGAGFGALSPDGSRSVALAASGPRVLDTWTGKELAQLPFGMEHFNFSPDGRRLFGYSAKGLTLWDADSGREVATLWPGSMEMPEKGAPEALSSAPRPPLRAEGKNLIYSDSSLVQVWNLEDGRRVLRAKMKSGSRVLAVDAGARRVAILERDGEVKIWRAESGILSELHGVRGIVAAAFTADGSRLAMASGDAVRVWNAKGRELFRFSLREPPSALAFSPDAKWILATGRAGSLRVWSADRGQDVASLAHEGPVESVAFSRDAARLVTVTGGKIVRVWKTDSWTELARLGFDSFLGFSPDGERLVTTRDTTAEVWKVGGQLRGMSLQNKVPVETRFSRDGRRLAFWSDTGVKILDMEKDEVIFQGRNGGDMSADGKKILLADVGGYQLWDIETQRKITTIPAEQTLYRTLSGDGRWLAIANDSRNLVQILETANSRGKVQFNAVGVSALTFSPDNRWLATAALKGPTEIFVQVWDVESGKEVAQLRHDGRARHLEFSPDGRWLTGLGNDHTIWLWEIGTGRTLELGHEGDANDLAFSPDGRWLVTGSDDTTARVWEVASGNQVARIPRRARITAVTFTADGRRIEIVDEDGHLTAEPWRIEDLIAQVCQRLRRNLSRREWEQYLGDEPYRETCPGSAVAPPLKTFDPPP